MYERGASCIPFRTTVAFSCGRHSPRVVAWGQEQLHLGCSVNNKRKIQPAGGAVSYHELCSLLASCGAAMLDDCGSLSRRSHGALQFRGPTLPVPVVCVARSLLKAWPSCTCATTFVFLIQQRIPNYVTGLREVVFPPGLAFSCG